MKASGASSGRVSFRRFVGIAASFPLLFVTFAWPARGQSATPAKSQEAVVAPNENLVVEGIPPISASLVEKADRYTNFRSAAFVSWHPTKREMLITTRFGDTFQIHEVKMPGGARTQLTFYRDDVRSARYPPK